MKKLIILLAALAMVGAFTASAMADVSLYGSARMWTYRIDKDKQMTGNFDTQDTRWSIGPFSRFGANFKSDKINGKFEMDVRDADMKDGGSRLGEMRLRHLFGQWDFGKGKLLIGHTWPLSDILTSSIQFTGGGFQEYGGLTNAFVRASQIRLTFGDLKIAFLSASAQRDLTANPLGTYSSRIERMLPKIEARYVLKIEPFKMDFFAGYQSIDYYNATDDSKSVDSYVVAFRGQTNFGPLYGKVMVDYIQNGGDYGLSTDVRNYAQFENNSVQDNTQYGVVLALGYKVSDMLTVEASYGQTHSEDDRSTTYEDDAEGYGIMAKVKLAPGVYIFPEYTYLNHDDRVDAGSVVQEGDEQRYGIVWKINFK